MKRINKNTVIIFAAAILILMVSSVVYSHCEIPCGIYDDTLRLDLMAEDITTIEKSMKEIQSLSQEKEKNYNQLVRWVMNKEHHSDALSDVVTQYFMKQRIAPVDSTDTKEYQDYVNKLVLLHKMMVYSMKCKQTTDPANVVKLRSLLAEFKKTYLGE